MDSESTDQTNHSSPTMISNYPKNSKIPNCRSLAYRHSTICVEETKFRRTRTVPSESPWGGAYIHPFDLIIPEDLRPLGKGFFSVVRVGFLHGDKVACKKLLGKPFKNKTENDLFMREISILSELKHCNVIKYLGTSICEQNRKIIVMEYMELGNLHDLLLSTQLDFKILVKIAKDTADGMQFLHDNKILHRDLNSKNILLTRNQKGLLAKVADFGLSRKKLEDTTLSYTMGQIPWMAPEVLQVSKNYTQKADVYSFGILMWQMVSRQSPCPPGLSYVNMASKVMTEQW